MFVCNFDLKKFHTHIVNYTLLKLKKIYNDVFCISELKRIFIKLSLEDKRQIHKYNISILYKSVSENIESGWLNK